MAANIISACPKIFYCVAIFPGKCATRPHSNSKEGISISKEGKWNHQCVEH